MTDSLIRVPLRLGVRVVRASLHATRDLADLGLATVEAVERALGGQAVGSGEAPPRPATREGGSFSDREGQKPSQRPRRRAQAQPAPAPPPPQEPEPEPEPEPTGERAELVDTVADPGAEDGAGASLRVAPPFPGYDKLRAPDVIDRLGGVDLAELGETELYERSHRARRTVLDAIAREIKRRPPNWVEQRP